MQLFWIFLEPYFAIQPTTLCAYAIGAIFFGMGISYVSRKFSVHIKNSLLAILILLSVLVFFLFDENMRCVLVVFCEWTIFGLAGTSACLVNSTIPRNRFTILMNVFMVMIVCVGNIGAIFYAWGFVSSSLLFSYYHASENIYLMKLIQSRNYDTSLRALDLELTANLKLYKQYLAYQEYIYNYRGQKDNMDQNIINIDHENRK